MPERIVEIERVGLKGQGVATDEENNVYFVERAVPGDRVRVSFPEGSRRYRDADIVDILTHSSNRGVSACPYFHRCGGCDWLDWSYPAQCVAKDEMVTHALARVGVIPRKRFPIHAANHSLGYRTRVQLRYESGRLGFYRRHSHELVDIESCAVAAPSINQRLSELRGQIPEGSGKVEVGLLEDGTVYCDWNKEHAFSGFTQVNIEQNTFLRSRVAESLSGRRFVLELFAGDGNLTVAFGESCEEVVAVELNTSARAKGEKRGIANVSFLCDRVDGTLLKRLPKEFLDRCDALLLDPPRQGLGADIGSLIPEHTNRLVYLSCSVSELAKDAARLSRLGWLLDELQCIDMFPQTRHVESLAVFKKGLIN